MALLDEILPYTAERTRDFTGREWVFDEIDTWLADLHLRIRKADHRIAVIIAHGRDWVLKSGE